MVTVEVFAARQGLDPQAYYRLLDSETEMDKQVFVYLSRSRLEMFYRNLLSETATLIERYWAQELAVSHSLPLGKEHGTTSTFIDHPGVQ